MAPKRDAANSIVVRTGVPAGWCEKAVADLARIVGGGTPDREQLAYWRNGTIPWITPTDLTANGTKYIESGAEKITELGLKNSNATLVNPGAIVFSTRGTVGSMAVAAVPLTCNQSCEVLVPRVGAVVGDFLYYLLNFGISAFIRLSAGTTFNSITRRDIVRVRFAVPRDVDEQGAIARLLDVVDKALERTQAAIERARTLRYSLIHGLLMHGIRKEEPKRSEAGLIPSSWKCDVLGGNLDEGPTNGVYRPESDYAPQGTRIVRIDDFADGQIHNLSGLRRVIVQPAIQRRYALSNDDVLINRVNSLSHIGKAALVPTLDEPTIFESNMMRLRCGPRLLPAFLLVVLCSDIARRHWLSRAKPAVNQASINQRDVRELLIPMPEPDEQQEIACIVSKANEQIEALRSVSKAQNALKRSLLNEVLSGRIRTMNAAEATAL